MTAEQTTEQPFASRGAVLLRPERGEANRAQQDCAPTHSPEAAARALKAQAESARSRTVLWLCVGAAFAALMVAWVVLFQVARSAKIQTVPPATQGGLRP